jgi:hypothetical protein
MGRPSRTKVVAEQMSRQGKPAKKGGQSGSQVDKREGQSIIKSAAVSVTGGFFTSGKHCLGHQRPDGTQSRQIVEARCA